MIITIPDIVKQNAICFVDVEISNVTSKLIMLSHEIFVIEFLFLDSQVWERSQV